MKPRAGFIEDIDLALALKVACQLDTLYLAARKSACGLSEGEITKPHICHALQGGAYLFAVEKVHSFGNRQLHHIFDI